MAKVFLSYDRDDTERARPVALALQKAGHAVWWDLHIRGGEQYTKVIDEALRAADAVVVLWSKNSVESAWVRDEAAAGRDSGRLVPVALDDTTPPLGFRQFQTIDLSHWKGRGKPAELKTLLADVASMARADPATEPAAMPSQIGRSKSLAAGVPKWAIVAVAVAVISAVAGYFYQKDRHPEVYAIAVTAADDAARPLARDLLVNLGRLQSVHSGAVRLIGPTIVPSDKPDLVYEVANDSDETAAGASLLLMKDRSVLWSSDFVQPSKRIADLKQQLAFTAGRVLECAFDAREGKALKQQALKVYLNACAELAELGQVSSPQIIASLLQVTRDAPWFKGGWAKLLLAESQSLDPDSGTDRERRATLRQHIEMSRQIEPDLPEIELAEFAEIGSAHLAQQSQIIDRAKSRHPDNPDVLGTRALFLLWVGRSQEAINDSRRAVELDPLSPARRNEFISALMYSGRIEAARQELEEANRLWPGTESISDIQFRFNLRYGDPKLAAGLMSRSGGPIMGPVLEAYIRARLDPTAANVDKVISSFPPSEVRNSPAFANLIQAMGEFHREEDLFALTLQPAHRSEVASAREIFFRPGLARFRSDPRFMQVANLAGLVDYWRTSGKWPDFCFEPDLPYDCKKEAAKLAA